jgi:hypothetical protein
MSTTPGARLISRVTGCRWRHAGCKGGFAAPDDATTDRWSPRPCIRQASRPVGDVPQGENK